MAIFSPATIQAINDVVTGGPGVGPTTDRYGVYKTGPQLERFMAILNLDFRVGQNSRMPALDAFLRGLNKQTDGLNHLKRIIEASVRLEDYDSEELHRESVDYLNRNLILDGFQLHQKSGKIQLISVGTLTPVIQALEKKAELLDIDSVQIEVSRIMEHVDEDPEDAITAACSMVESVCKFILNDTGKPIPTKKDIAHLVKETQNKLNLSPARNDLSDEIKADVKKVLGGLSSVAEGIGALRTHGGDAHGKEKGAGRVDARISRLAIHAASTISLFLIETWQIRKDNDANKKTISKTLNSQQSVDSV